MTFCNLSDSTQWDHVYPLDMRMHITRPADILLTPNVYRGCYLIYIIFIDYNMLSMLGTVLRLPILLYAFDPFGTIYTSNIWPPCIFAACKLFHESRRSPLCKAVDKVKPGDIAKAIAHKAVQISSKESVAYIATPPASMTVAKEVCFVQVEHTVYL